jgi:hypothetical protein
VTELVTQRPAEVVHVLTGELIPASDANALAGYLKDLRDLRARAWDQVRIVEDLLVEEAERQGTKTLHLEGATAKVTSGPELQWDTSVLEELKDAGLPDERWNALVSIVQTFKVDARVAKQLETSSRYRGIIERARSYREKPYRVAIS